MITKNVGERCAFTGGNEITPEVEIVMHLPPPGSLQDNEKVLLIKQNGRYIQVSAKTLAAILEWAC